VLGTVISYRVSRCYLNNDRHCLSMKSSRYQIDTLSPISNLPSILLSATIFLCAPVCVQADIATFSGGEFHYLQSTFNDMRYNPSYNKGIEKVTVGFIHEADGLDTQAVQVTYDPSKVSYKQILGTYWRNVRPTQPNGQFNDKGPQYRSIIWTTTDNEKVAAEKSKSMIFESGIYEAKRDPVTFVPLPPGPPLVTEINALLTSFTPAPDSEQMIDASKLKSKAESSGRTKYFKDAYGVRTYSDPKTKIGGFVTFPCSDMCIQAIDGLY